MPLAAHQTETNFGNMTMKTISILAIAAFAGVFGFAGAASATCTGNTNPSLIHNGGFETGSGTTITDWNVGYSDDVHVDLSTTYKKGGRQSLRLGTTDHEDRVWQKIANLVPGNVYTVCFWALGEQAFGTASLRAQWNNSDMIVLRNGMPQSAMMYYAFNVVATGNDVLSFEERNDPAYFFVDNVDVQLCSECEMSNGTRQKLVRRLPPPVN
jgi:hypothetical protein